MLKYIRQSEDGSKITKDKGRIHGYNENLLETLLFANEPSASIARSESSKESELKIYSRATIEEWEAIPDIEENEKEI